MYVRACEYLPSYCISASITKQSAPSRIAFAEILASSFGCSPHTYCQAHTLSPPAFSAATLCGNWDQYGWAECASPLFTKTVLTWCARALAMIAPVEPPLDLLTYQIHIPFWSNTLRPAAAPGSERPTATATIA